LKGVFAVGLRRMNDGLAGLRGESFAMWCRVRDRSGRGTPKPGGAAYSHLRLRHL